MKVGRGRIVLGGNKLIERCLLLRCAAQHQDDIGHDEIGPNWPQVVPGIRRRMDVALESYELILVDSLKNPWSPRCTLGEGLVCID